ncbi:MAG: hypothetical protein IPK58_12470 [Acidobacteria bacterium]|nr:hypothetical protein [Acidobacteriota bacterium]
MFVRVVHSESFVLRSASVNLADVSCHGVYQTIDLFRYFTSNALVVDNLRFKY